MSPADAAAAPRVHPQRLLRGWGRTAPTSAAVAGLIDLDDIRASLRDTPRGVLGRGLGRSYGDGAQNSGGVVVDATTSIGITSFEPGGRITAKAGTSLEQLMEWMVPMGFFVPVTPGTRQVTVGGAIAADIHGKNHHRAGSWCNHVESFRLMVGSGEVLDVSGTDPDLFWATAGEHGTHRPHHRRHLPDEADRVEPARRRHRPGPDPTASWRSWSRATPRTTTPSLGSTS